MTGRDARSRDENGFSLIETLVALAILAIILPSFSGLIFTEIASARSQRESAVDNAAMVSVAEAVKAETYDVTCPYPTLPWTALTTPSLTLSCAPPLAVGSYFVQTVTITAYYGVGNTGPHTQVVVVKGSP